MLADVVSRQKNFYKNKQKGNMICSVNIQKDKKEIFINYSITEMLKQWYVKNDELPSKQNCFKMVEMNVKEFRKIRDENQSTPNEFAPTLYAHIDIGYQVSVITGTKPLYSGTYFWNEPNIEYEKIFDIQFNPDNKFFQTMINIYEAFVHYCEEDYFTMPYIHRSPLDMANGLKGTDIFVDMYANPETVKEIVNKVVEIQLAQERYIYEQVPDNKGCKTGCMGMILPDKAVWVNGDPVGLISRQMMLEFEQPYTGRLFTGTGGGFFHNHELGLYQVDQVAKTPGIVVQQFTKDPSVESLKDLIVSDEKICQKVCDASVDTPIMLPFSLNVDELDEYLPILKQGRFIFSVLGKKEDKHSDIFDRINKYRTNS